MNIFVTSPSAKDSAIALDDKRVVKMVLETAQLLCTVINEKCGQKVTKYKSTHVNHPCTKWAGLSKRNFIWLCEYGNELAEEYTHRYNKTHKSHEVILHAYTFMSMFPDRDLDEFVNCAANTEHNLCFKHITPTIEAYKMYLRERWKTDKLKPKWTNRSAPTWK